MSRPEPIADADRVAADVFGKSYREFLELKPTHYRWSHLAPQAVAWLADAHEGRWSNEKIADYLHCGPEEAEACLRRYVVSKRVNSGGSEAERMRRAFSEWIGMQPGMEDLDKAERERRAGGLALIVANHLRAAAGGGLDIMKLSIELEGSESGSGGKSASGGDDGAAPGGKPRGDGDAKPPWGPQWKD